MKSLVAYADDLRIPAAVGVVPTDTIYGLVARAADIPAAERLYELKKRENKPGTIITANIDQLVELGIKRRYLTAVEQFWPGAISVIVPCADQNLAYLHRGKMSLAVRIPDIKELRELLERAGPLLTSSANHTGEPSATTVAQARAYFKDEVDFYVDGGDLAGHEPSTIVRIVDDAVEILRQGAVKIDEAGRKIA